MHVRAPMLKYSERSSSRDNFAFRKKKHVTTSIFPLLRRGRAEIKDGIHWK